MLAWIVENKITLDHCMLIALTAAQCFQFCSSFISSAVQIYEVSCIFSHISSTCCSSYVWQRFIPRTNAQILTTYSCTLYPLGENKLSSAIHLHCLTFSFQIKSCETGETLGIDITYNYFQLYNAEKRYILYFDNL